MRELTVDEVLATCLFQFAIKVAPTKIRPFTEADVQLFGSSFLDLEGRLQRVEIGRYLCVGIDGEMWTCSAKSMEQRQVVSDADEEGFRLYVMRDPVPVLVTFLHEPFCLYVREDRWVSQGGAITWNGKYGAELSMRVIEGSIFVRTYQLVEE